jgi:hypothetical protein
MSTAIPKTKSAAARRPSESEIEKQIRQGKTVLRALRATLEDLERSSRIGGCAEAECGQTG